MRRTLALLASSAASARPELIRIRNATFFREHPTSVGDAATNPPLFQNLNFSLSATKVGDETTRKDEHWAVIAANDGTTFLDVLRGSHICLPPNSRTYPYLSSEDIDRKDHRLRIPSRAIQYVGFMPGKGKSQGSGIQGAYLSARYESHREETDWSVQQYLKGETELNPLENKHGSHIDDRLLSRVVADLRLENLLSMPVSNLSNGQTRRSRIAKALLGNPELLLLDDPFMGLDPPTLVRLSPILRDLAYNSSPLLLLALRPQDPIPDWITHLAILGHNNTVPFIGAKADVLFAQHHWANIYGNSDPNHPAPPTARNAADQLAQIYGPPLQDVGTSLTDKGVVQYDATSTFSPASDAVPGGDDGEDESADLTTEQRARVHQIKAVTESRLRYLWSLVARPPSRFTTSTREPASGIQCDAVSSTESSGLEAPRRQLGEPVIELESVVVKYGDKVVLGHSPPQSGFTAPGLNLSIYQGSRLALLGPNGSGKTTFLSLLTSDHPQSYSLPIKFFGRPRLPEPGKPGLSLWEIQSRIGHSAPEVHAFFPKRLSIRQTLESAWAETYISKPKLSYERDEMVDAFLRWWEPELRQDRATISAPGEAYHKKFRDVSSGSRLDRSRTIKSLVESSYPPYITLQTPFGKSPAEDAEHRSLGGVDWAEDKDTHSFGMLPFGTQRLLLLLRAMIKQPDILILDEAFSGLSADVRDKAMCFLEYGETKFLINQPDLDAVRLGMYEKPTAHDRRPWDNHRVDIQRLVHANNLELSKVLANRSRSGGYDELLERSKEELLQQAQNFGRELGNGTRWVTNTEVRDYRFKGLTDRQAMVVVSHVKEEVPVICDEWVRLPGEEEVQQGKSVEMGWVGRGGIARQWSNVWGIA
ncbi:uncharacterized protein HMPREF1541_03718 [Cyphellophora europaea CBS 101466]|uniref:ABC transporter domain-containing protein n=1 Tax=Cyphellophora europaea (strain CBS 101466) TaxID=1220924 RepID=W2RZ54_CYPE1|nr:uncharacterized protein HMPREF1541_03718 [Cyphellophora europaea CBS 101466]ETN41781.1 hypothetical protein HMPREF1541_03718 [Cyphellophora europaea CBS 101466]